MLKLIKIYRYYRPHQFDETRLNIESAPKGGITFLFTLEQSIAKVCYSYAVCADDENFSFEIGKNIATGRDAAGQVDVLESYNRDIGLIDNVIAELEADKPSLTNDYKILLNKMLQIRSINKHCEKRMSSMNDVISAKVAALYAAAN